MLSHLVYVSQKTPKCTAQEIENILASCQKNNTHMDATGVLLHSDTHFLQYLEGEYKVITELYDKIKMDDRHKNAILLSTGAIKEKIFPSWQMAEKQFRNEGIAYLTDMDAAEEKQFTNLLMGKQEGAEKAVVLIKKFFK